MFYPSPHYPLQRNGVTGKDTLKMERKLTLPSSSSLFLHHAELNCLLFLNFFPSFTPSVWVLMTVGRDWDADGRVPRCVTHYLWGCLNMFRVSVFKGYTVSFLSRAATWQNLMSPLPKDFSRAAREYSPQCGWLLLLFTGKMQTTAHNGTWSSKYDVDEWCGW